MQMIGKKKTYLSISIGFALSCFVPIVQHLLDTINGGLLYLLGNLTESDIFDCAIEINLILFVVSGVSFLLARIQILETIAFIALCHFSSAGFPYLGERLNNPMVSEILLLYVLRPLAIILVSYALIKAKESRIFSVLQQKKPA